MEGRNRGDRLRGREKGNRRIQYTQGETHREVKKQHRGRWKVYGNEKIGKVEERQKKRHLYILE